MGNNAVKTIIIVLVLVVLSFIVGAQVSDNVRDSAGAFFLIACVIGMFFMLWMGTNSWKLIFIVPLLMPFMPFQLEFVPPHMAMTCVIGIYWVAMRALGHAHFTWRTLPLLDWQIAIVFCYMAVGYYRHPVTVKVLGLDYDYVGGTDYIYCVWCILYYVILSSLPIRLHELLTLLKKVFFISLGIGFFFACKGMSAGSEGSVGEHMSAEETLEKGRFGFFTSVGTKLLCWVYLHWPIQRILRHGTRMGMAVFGLLSVLVSGGRTNLITLSIPLAFIAMIKREFLFLLLSGCLVYMGLLGLSVSGALQEAPYGMQRVVSILPGLRISQEAEEDTKESSEIRKRMWKNALDPRTGLIKDYVWGDGYQSSLAMQERDKTARMRGVSLDQQKFMEQSGSWHNGWVSMIHRVGIIGLILLQVLMLSAVLILYQVACALIKIPDGIYGILPLLGILAPAFTSSFLVMRVLTVLMCFPSYALMKIFYCQLREKGLLEPLFPNQRYVPLMIREQEAVAAGRR